MADPFTVEHFEWWAHRLILDSGDPWRLEQFQLDFVRDLFEMPAESEVWLIVGEGNGKTTLLAGLGLYGLRFGEGASIPMAASSRDQARIMYRQAKGFLQRSSLDDPGLWLEAFDGYKRIDLRGPGDTKRGEVLGSFEVHAADAGTGDGIIPFPFALVDELHRHRSLELYETWRGKLGKRGAKLVTISTGGEAGTEFEETRDRIRRETPAMYRRPGFCRYRSDRLLLHEFKLEDGADPADMEAVKRCSPLPSITVESLTAKRGSPTMSQAHWTRFVCNLATRSVEAAVSEREWSEAAVPLEQWRAGEPVWAGLDLGWQHDTTALVPLYVRDEEFRLFGEATILEPLGDGTMLDPHLVENAIIGLHARNPIASLVMDTSHGAQLASWVESELGIPVVARQQTNPLAALDYAAFMEALREGWLHHVGDDGLTRHVLNAVTRLLPGGASRFDRPHQSRASAAEQRRRVIDGLTAASMVHGVAAANLQKRAYRTAGFH